MIQDNQLLEKFHALPAEKQSEVIDFIEHLQNKEKLRLLNSDFNIEDDLILKVAGTLSLPSITSQEIDEELYG